MTVVLSSGKKLPEAGAHVAVPTPSTVSKVAGAA